MSHEKPGKLGTPSIRTELARAGVTRLNASQPSGRPSLLPGSILARRLESALASFEQAVAQGGQPSRLDLAHPLHMRRGFIRHPAYYRVKASISGLFQVLNAGALLPVVPVLWLLASKEDRAREAARYRAYRLKCEVEDLMDEIERRVKKGKQAT